MSQTLTQKIGNFLNERREVRMEREELNEILRQNGYEDEVFESIDCEDVNVFGNPVKYKIKHKFGKPQIMEEGLGRYALVPVKSKNEYREEEIETLVLVDRNKKQIREVVNRGSRGIHYQGRGKITPLALRIDDGEATISYRFSVTPGLTDDIRVSTDHGVFQRYLFRDSETNIAKIRLEERK